jgi:hypothetical protein
LNLASSSANIADSRRCPRFAAGTIADTTEHRSVDGEGFVHTKYSFRQVEVDSKQCVLTALGTRLRTALTSAKEGLKNVPESKPLGTATVEISSGV